MSNYYQSQFLINFLLQYCYTIYVLYKIKKIKIEKKKHC